MIFYLVNKDKLQFLLVLLRLLFESGVVKHANYACFSVMFTGVDFLLSLHSLKFLHLHIFSFHLSDICEIVSPFQVNITRLWLRVSEDVSHFWCLPCLQPSPVIWILQWASLPTWTRHPPLVFWKTRDTSSGLHWWELVFTDVPQREQFFGCEVHWCIKNESYVLSVWKCSTTVGRAFFPFHLVGSLT